MMPLETPLAQLVRHAAHAASVLKLLANEQRLLILCRLTQGEFAVGQMVELCGQSQSSVSQHLGKLREGGLVKTRRDGTTIYYSLADDDVRKLIDMLCERFGPAGGQP
ncbi:MULTISPECIES: metalloregulator ArsR/SmtB family transcription factor [unclassified Sphingomonas]|uniref:ArsR/SmtB family transcription factor n=1 Tax=unclassified Sphingomonas TaxID=196159 RepID=UPI00092614F2|nr:MULTISPECIES: metalloregulator ArsR/SmtB family transcription factor [unclassified Sphingomonas]MBN8847111.1 helix-turn-helix transcriptional regulator [Sphingomonas sp.]MBS0282984.1 helix-turn-helix transcriptional regulator [Pseudomonadota bacterium]OJV33197.1 MAG: transcriptional regulator [Sphingomonas sp. 67-36]